VYGQGSCKGTLVMDEGDDLGDHPPGICKSLICEGILECNCSRGWQKSVAWRSIG
jgi:hypothetical protein